MSCSCWACGGQGLLVNWPLASRPDDEGNSRELTEAPDIGCRVSRQLLACFRPVAGQLTSGQLALPEPPLHRLACRSQYLQPRMLLVVRFDHSPRRMSRIRAFHHFLRRNLVGVVE